MGGKHNKCCCCGCLRGRTACCACTCRRLCVTFTPTPGSVGEDYDECPVVSDELDWDEGEEAFIGEVSGIDVRYYFESDDSGCYFKLRSTVLGFPEGYEAQWSISDPEAYESTGCLNLITAVSVSEDPDTFCTEGELTTACAEKPTITHCTGCGCICECLCVTYTNSDGEVYTAKACWDGYGQWTGEIVISEYETKNITIAMHAAGDLCFPEYDPYCDPDDRQCVLVSTLDNDEATLAYLVPTCPDVAGTFEMAADYGEGETIQIRCAECSETCESRVTPCCEGFPLPPTIYATVETHITVRDNFDGGVVVFDEDCSVQVFGCAIDESEVMWSSGGFSTMADCERCDFVLVGLKMEIYCIAAPVHEQSTFGFRWITDDDECGAGGLGEIHLLGVLSCDPFFAGYVETNAQIFRCCTPEFARSGGDGQYVIEMTNTITFTG